MKKEFEHIDQFLRNLGYWKGPDDPRYGYLPTVEPLALADDIKQQLRDIGKLVLGYQRYVNALVEEALSLPPNNHWGALIGRIVKQASSGLAPAQMKQVVPICKVDMIYSHAGMQVAEIDAYNPRGIPYAILLSNLYGIDSPVETVLRDAFGGKSFAWVHANHERYYANVLTSMRKIIAEKHGVDIAVMNSNDITTVPERMAMVPWGLRAPRESMHIAEMQERASQGGVWFPVAPWLSSKSFLGIVWHKLRAGECTGELKELIHRYIPETFLLEYKILGTAFEKNEYVIKPVVSSGHKGVSKAPEDIASLICKTPSHIAQKFSEPKSRLIAHYCADGSVATDDFFLRITGYYDASGKFLDAEATGRKEWLVHGAPDCIQCPIIFG